MALFRAQIAYLRAATRDVAFGTNVRALLSTAGADTNFTVTYTSTTAATQTVNPYTNISNVTADNRTNLGWAFNQNEASTDGVGSTSTRKRIIPAGTWSFSNSLAGSAPPLLANYNVTLEYSVYRVAAAGGARSLLFSFSGAAVNRTASGTFTYTATSPSQPLYILDPNETLHLAIRITSAATSSVLGGTTNTVITVNGATSGSQTMTLPAPGMRDLYFDSNTATGNGVGTESILTRKDVISAVGEGAGVIDYLAEFFRAFSAVGEGAGNEAIFVRKDTRNSVGKGVGTESILVRKDLISAAGKGLGTESILVRKDTFFGIGEGAGSYARLQELFREFASVGSGLSDREVLTVMKFAAAVGSGTGTIARRLELARAFLAAGKGTSTRSNFVRKDLITAIGEGAGTFDRAVVFVRDFIATGAGVGDLAKSVIFVRDFNAVGKAVIRPRISLDWDDLPDPGSGGGTIVNVYRPLFVFDD